LVFFRKSLIFNVAGYQPFVGVTRETRAMLVSRLKIMLAENGLTPQQPRKLLYVKPHRAVLDFRTGSGAVLILLTAADHAGD
jgi:hypothetical protein